MLSTHLSRHPAIRPAALPRAVLRLLAAWMLMVGFALCAAAPAAAVTTVTKTPATSTTLAQACTIDDDDAGGWRPSGPGAPAEASLGVMPGVQDLDPELSFELPSRTGVPVLLQPWSMPVPCTVHAGPAPRGLLRPPDA